MFRKRPSWAGPAKADFARRGYAGRGRPQSEHRWIRFNALKGTHRTQAARQGFLRVSAFRRSVSPALMPARTGAHFSP